MALLSSSLLFLYWSNEMDLWRPKRFYVKVQFIATRQCPGDNVISCSNEPHLKWNSFGKFWMAILVLLSRAFVFGLNCSYALYNNRSVTTFHCHLLIWIKKRNSNTFCNNLRILNFQKDFTGQLRCSYFFVLWVLS
jgi:hypothetical protein